MNQKKELIKNTIIISIGKFSTQLVSFLLLPLYTSLLTTTEYGQYDFLNTISIFIIPCVTLLMEEGMFRFLIDVKNDKDKSEVFSATFIFTILSFLIWSFLILVVGKLFNYPFSIFLIFYIFASLLSSLAGSTARGLGKFKIYSIFCFLSSISTILLNILFIVVLKMGLPSLFISYIIGNSLVSLWLLGKIKVYQYVSYKNINKNTLKDMVKYSFPLVPNSISWNAIALTDRLLIVNILGDSKNGIYSVGNRFPTIINTCYSYFNISWKESASKVVNNKDKNAFYNDIYINLNRLLICISILVIAILPFIFPILVKNDYREAYFYIPLMTISVYFSNLSNFCSGIFSAYKDTKILAKTTIVATIINFIVGISFIRIIGVYASIIGTLTAYFIIFIYRNFKLKKYIVLEKDKYACFHFIILILITAIYYYRNIYLEIFGLLIATIYTYYLNKNIIEQFIKKLKRK